MSRTTLYALALTLSVAVSSGCAAAADGPRVGAADATATNAAVATPEATAPAAAACTTATGARWRWGRKSGTSYIVDRHGAVTCAFARLWIKRLTAKRPIGSGHERTIPGGPARWRCSTSFPVRFPRAWVGICAKNGRTFHWRPRLR
jgi:hypothetical protein